MTLYNRVLSNRDLHNTVTCHSDTDMPWLAPPIPPQWPQGWARTAYFRCLSPRPGPPAAPRWLRLVSATAPSLLLNRWGRVGMLFPATKQLKALHHWHTTQHALSPAQIKARQVSAAGTVVEHGHSFLLHDWINWQIDSDGLECAGENQNKLSVPASVAETASGTRNESEALGTTLQWKNSWGLGYHSKPLPLKSMSVAKSNCSTGFGLIG
jgi:hypothetical protein